MNPATGAPVIGNIDITCDAAMNVTYEFNSNVPPSLRRFLATVMCEKAKLDLHDQLKAQEEAARAQLIEPAPPGFDPGKVRLAV